MAQDIVSGLFGLSPYEAQQQYNQGINTAADKFAGQAPMQQAMGLLYRGGAGLAEGAGGMFGLQNPAVAEAQARQAALTGLDISSPESILQRAQQVQDPKIKMQLMMLADQKKKEQMALSLEAKKLAREDWRMGEEFEWKKEQKRLELEQRAEAARLRSEDVRFSASERAAAAREASQTRLMIAQMMADAKKSAQESKVKPDLPTPALKMQQEELDAIGTSNLINKDLAKYQGQIEDKTLDLGLISNLVARGRNLAGQSDPASQAFANFVADMEKMRNDSLRLNKGTQTEGDAVRAWNELFANINDPDVVRSRLKTIREKNVAAAEFRKKNVNAIRKNYNAGPFDFSEYDVPAAPSAAPDLTAAAKAEIERRAKGGK
jgi:hypothetical protein